MSDLNINWYAVIVGVFAIMNGILGDKLPIGLYSKLDRYYTPKSIEEYIEKTRFLVIVFGIIFCAESFRFNRLYMYACFGALAFIVIYIYVVSRRTLVELDPEMLKARRYK